MWRDEDRAGIQDPDETETTFGWVALYNEDGAMVAQTTVNNDGSFAFTVAAGTYRLFATQASFNPSPQDQGDDDALDSDVDAGGSSDWFTLAPDEAIGLDVGMMYMV